MRQEIGKTKDSGYQIGVRKTVNANVRDVWEYMISGKGLAIWIGEPLNTLNVGEDHIFSDGTNAKITVVTQYSHIRMTWRKKGWKNVSRLQMRTVESGHKTVIAFHQELLADPSQREAMKTHWQKILVSLSDKFD